MAVTAKNSGQALTAAADLVITPIVLANKSLKLSSCRNDNNLPGAGPREEIDAYEKQIIKGIFQL